MNVKNVIIITHIKDSIVRIVSNGDYVKKRGQRNDSRLTALAATRFEKISNICTFYMTGKCLEIIL
ncbi:MAG TPA: hypothetical protein VH415_05380 [Nitrososphaeraceae archaeon]|jgi:hypothetical protein